jgi:hypothetical protein
MGRKGSCGASDAGDGGLGSSASSEVSVALLISAVAPARCDIRWRQPLCGRADPLRAARWRPRFTQCADNERPCVATLSKHKITEKRRLSNVRWGGFMALSVGQNRRARGTRG